MKKMPIKRVMVFIDGANLYKLAKKQNCNPGPQEIENLVKRLVGDRELIRAYYYTAIPDLKREQESNARTRSFLSSVEKLPYFEVCLGRLRYPQGSGKPHQKGVDVKMATDMLEYANDNLYNVAIIISGDGDFAYVLPFIKKKGKHIENACFKNGSSEDLRKKSDIFIELDCSWFKNIL